MTDVPADNTKSIALVIDGEVVKVLHTTEELAAILLSAPAIVEVTAADGRVRAGDTYDAATQTFTLVP